MAAESEKVLRNPDSLAAEHLHPNPRHDLLGRGPRCHIPDLFRSGLGYEVGEDPPIDLAVGRQRQPFEDDERPGHHVLRQEPPQGQSQLSGRRRRARRPLDIGYEPPVAGPVLADENRRPAHPGAGRERRFDLPQLDAETADLHLLVDPAQEIDLAARQGARQVPRRVEPRSGLRREGVGDELLRRKLGPPQVARPYSHTADRKLSGHPERHRRQMAVQNQQAETGERAADGGRSRNGFFRERQPVERHHVGALGRPVGVDHLGVTPDGSAPGGEPRRGDRLAAQEDAAQRGQPFEPTLLEEGVEGARGAVEPGDPVALDGGDDLSRIVGRRVGEDEKAATEERGEEVLLRQVEARRGHHQEAVLGRDAELLHVPAQKVDETALIDPGALRHARRSRGVDDVEQVFRSVRSFQERTVPRGSQLHLAVQAEHRRSVFREASDEIAPGEDHGGPGVLQQEGQALRRVRGIENDVGSPGPQGGEEADDEIRRAFEAEPHPAPRPHAELPQP